MMNRLYDRLQPVWFWWPWFMLFNIGDVITTYVFLSKGYGEGNPIFHSSVYDPPFIILKLFVLPCLVIPFLALVLSPKGFQSLLRGFTFLLLNVVIWNIVGMNLKPVPVDDPKPYSIFQMLLLTYGLLIPAYLEAWGWSKLCAWVSRRTCRLDLAPMLVR